MEVCVNVVGVLTELIKVENGVKKENFLAPTLFSISLAMVLTRWFGYCNVSIMIRYTTSGKLHKLRRFTVRTKSADRVRLNADDCDVIGHTTQHIQQLMD